MKSHLLAALLSLTAAAPRPAVIPAAPPSAGYSGAWTLDQAQSTGLPPYYANVRSHRLDVAQSDSQLVVDVEIDAGRGAPDRMRFAYRLDGTETAATTQVRTPNGLRDVPTRLRATRDADGHIHITITRELRLGERTMTGVGTEEWELRPDGRTLVVHRLEQMPQGGETRAEMVFVRS
jgi:hypothetical protein